VSGMPPQLRCLSAGTTLLLMMMTCTTYAARTDVVAVENGDRITCEIKELDRGLLRLKTDYMDTVYVEWIHVKSVQSKTTFEVELTDGTKVYGSLHPVEAEDNDQLEIILDIPLSRESRTVAYASIVRLSPIKKTVLDRFSGSIDMGLSYATTNAAKSLTLDVVAAYRTRKHKFSGSLATSFSERGDTELTPRTLRNTLDIQVQRKLRPKWFSYITTRFEQDEEFELDLRTSIGAGGGRFFVQTNRTLFSVSGGLTGTRESYVGVEDSENLEAVVSSQYQYFTFGEHRSDFNVNLWVRPSLTDWGRYRVEVDANARYELFKDFFFGAHVTQRYDSSPPGDSGEPSDVMDRAKDVFEFRTTIGFTF